VRRPVPDSALGLGLTLAYRGMTLGLEFALPALAGRAADRHWGTGPLLTLLGATLGFAVGMWHLLRITAEGPRTRPGGPDPNNESQS